MADGNFKADHVRQKNSSGDVWLSEGAGMIPEREQYHGFLKTAIERLTVSFFFLPMLFLLMTHAYSAYHLIRRHRVKISFRLL